MFRFIAFLYKDHKAVYFSYVAFLVSAMLVSVVRLLSYEDYKFFFVIFFCMVNVFVFSKGYTYRKRYLM